MVPANKCILESTPRNLLGSGLLGVVGKCGDVMLTTRIHSTIFGCLACYDYAIVGNHRTLKPNSPALPFATSPRASRNKSHLQRTFGCAQQIQDCIKRHAIHLRAQLSAAHR